MFLDVGDVGMTYEVMKLYTKLRWHEEECFFLRNTEFYAALVVCTS